MVPKNELMKGMGMPALRGTTGREIDEEAKRVEALALVTLDTV